MLPTVPGADCSPDVPIKLQNKAKDGLVCKSGGYLCTSMEKSENKTKGNHHEIFPG